MTTGRMSTAGMSISSARRSRALAFLPAALALLLAPAPSAPTIPVAGTTALRLQLQAVRDGQLLAEAQLGNVAHMLARCRRRPEDIGLARESMLRPRFLELLLLLRLESLGAGSDVAPLTRRERSFLRKHVVEKSMFACCGEAPRERVRAAVAESQSHPSGRIREHLAAYDTSGSAYNTDRAWLLARTRARFGEIRTEIADGGSARARGRPLAARGPGPLEADLPGRSLQPCVPGSRPEPWRWIRAGGCEAQARELRAEVARSELR